MTTSTPKSTLASPAVVQAGGPSLNFVPRWCARFGVPRRAVRPSTAVKTLVPPDGAAAWKELRGELGLPAWVTLPKRGQGPTVGEMARTMVGCKPRRFGPPNGRWSRHEVREVVRAIVVEETGVPSDYSDDARLVRDLGIN